MTVQQFEHLGTSQPRNCFPQISSALERDIISLDGDRQHLGTSASSLRQNDGSVVQFGVSHDVAARKRTQERLRDNKPDLRHMTETMPEMLWSATPEGTIDYCNASVLDYTGLSAEEVIGKSWTRILHPDEVEQTTQMWRSCTATGSPYRAEVRAFHAADRTYRWCVASALPLRDGQGNILKWRGGVVDVHDWKQTQEEFRYAQAELEHMTRVMTMGELTASIAHEVNQPLASIIANGETALCRLARPEPDVDKIRELTGRMVDDARRASEIIDSIRAMATRKAPQQMPLSLNDVIHESIGLLRHEFQLKSVSVSLDLAPALPYVVGDRTQLHQVIVNLAINAVQAMERSVGARRSISIRATLSDPKTVFCSVEDSGPGIDAGYLPRLFESFFTTKETGMGMGLPICRSIVEAHRGEIRADNNSALGGARFSFALPANCEVAQLASGR
jgi:PAS domain S-box-containing protein